MAEEIQTIHWLKDSWTLPWIPQLINLGGRKKMEKEKEKEKKKPFRHVFGNKNHLLSYWSKIYYNQQQRIRNPLQQ